MFYHACRYDDCSRHFARMLYTGVRLGTWASGLSSRKSSTSGEASEEIRDKFWQIIDESKAVTENEDLDLLDKIIEKNLSQ